jgi:hypothetical protein
MATIDNRSKTTKTLWQRFGAFVKDPRIKVIAYPLVALSAVILAALGNFLWIQYGPGDIHLSVQVNDGSDKPLKGAMVGFEQNITGGAQSLPTDAFGRASFTIPHANMGSKITLSTSLDNYQAPADLPSLVLDRNNPRITIKLQRIPIAPLDAESLPMTQGQPPPSKQSKPAGKPGAGTKSSKALPLTAKATRPANKISGPPVPGAQANPAKLPIVTTAAPLADKAPAEPVAPPLPAWIEANWGVEVKNKKFTLTGESDTGKSLSCAATLDQSLRISRSGHSLIFKFEQSIDTTTREGSDLETNVQCSSLSGDKEWDVSAPIDVSVRDQNSLSFMANMDACHGRCKVPGRRARVTGTIRHLSVDQIEVELPGSLEGPFRLLLGQ